MPNGTARNLARATGFAALSRTMIEHFQLKLVDSRMLAPTVRHLEFERADGTPFKFTPGQFIQVHFNYDDGKPTKRSYSVGTPAEGPEVDRLELAVSFVEGGAASEHDLHRGGRLHRRTVAEAGLAVVAPAPR